MINIVKDIPDFLVGEARNIRHILVQYNEKLFFLVRLDDVADYVVTILEIHSQHLAGLSLALDRFGQFGLESLLQVGHPDVVWRFIHDPGMQELGGYQKVLVDEVEQVLQISVYASFGVDGLHVRAQQMVELYE